MTVYCPFTSIRTETARVLSARDDVEYVNVASDDEAYWRLLSKVWAAGRTFVIVEHDIVPPPGAIDSMLACPRRWCAVPYPDFGTLNVGHGLTKYDAAVVADYPDLLDKVAQRHWRYLDAWMQTGLCSAHDEPLPHWHWPAAEHLKHGVDYGYEFGRCETCGVPLTFLELRAGPGATVCRAGHPVRYWEAQHFDRALGRV